MATKFTMTNPKTGEIKTAFYGYSWTTLFFGAFPALFRKDFITFIGVFIVAAIIGFLTLGLGGLFISLVWSFMYNKYYSTNLLKQGFVFSGSDMENKTAAAALGVILNDNNTLPALRQNPAV